jgi:DNA-binding SARP family transcriptional activator
MPEEIRLLGGFGVVTADPVRGLNAGRLQSLLAYLLLHRGAPQQRQHLAFLFWPDTQEAQAHSNLRTLVHRLRRALPQAERFLEVDGDTLLWRADAPCTLDVAEFEAAAGEDASLPQLRRAIALYRGALLPGCYEEWIEPERERLRHLFAIALERAAECLEAQRDYRGALEYARQTVRHNPLDEEGYRRVMRLHALTGDRAGALRMYKQCASTLQSELGVQPDAATRDAYTRLLGTGATDTIALSVESTNAGLPMVGRDEEWQQLQRAWSAALAGTPQLAVLAGGAGIGKTRLAEEFAAWAERQGFHVARGHAYAAHGVPAYGAIVPWVKAGLLRNGEQPLEPLWLSEIARILPQLLIENPGLEPPTPIVDGWQRGRFFEALARAVLADGRPLLLVLDDLQWCGGETLAWLHHLLRFDPHARLLIVAPLRPHEVDANHPLSALLLALRRTAQCTEIPLGPLDDAQSARLAAAVSGSATTPLMDVVGAGAEGNPLFIVEMVRYHLTVGTVAGASPRTDAAALPPTIQAVIAARLAQLTPLARELVGCAAVIGRHFPLEVLSAISGIGERRMAKGLDELCRRQIVAERQGEHFDFTHEKLREVAYAALGTIRRRRLHRRAEQALAACASEPGRSSGELALHAERAGMTGSAMRHHLAVARAAHHLGATADAISSLDRALSLFEPRTRTSPVERAIAVEVRELLGDLLHLTGRYPESQEIYQRALREAPEPLRRARLYRKVGKTRSGQHEYAVALRAFRAAEGLLEPEPEDDPDRCREWLQIQLDRTSVLYWTGDWCGTEETHRGIAPLLERYATSRQRRDHAQSIISMRLRRDRYTVSEEMLSLSRRNVLESVQEGHVPTIAVARFRHAFNLLWAGALPEAEEEATLALELTQRTGDSTLAARCLTYLAVIYRKQGDIEAVGAYAERSLRAGTELGMAEYVGAARANQAWLAWRSGNDREACSHAQTALSVWAALPTQSAPFMFQWLALWPLVAVTLESGVSARIGEAADYARQLLHPTQQRLPQALAAPLEAATRAWETGDAEGALTCLREAVSLAGELGYL